MRWLHVFFGILWIGLLYYFNFVQIRVMPLVPAELKPGVSKYIAPEALFIERISAGRRWPPSSWASPSRASATTRCRR